MVIDIINGAIVIDISLVRYDGVGAWCLSIWRGASVIDTQILYCFLRYVGG